MLEVILSKRGLQSLAVSLEEIGVTQSYLIGIRTNLKSQLIADIVFELLINSSSLDSYPAVIRWKARQFM